MYFGYIARGRFGGLLAGLGFILPGFVLMLAISWAYVRYGIARIAPAGLFYGFQAAVLALIVRAVQRIGRHAVTDPWLWPIAAAAAASDLADVHFGLTLIEADPVCEDLVRKAMAIEAAIGRRAAALDRYRKFEVVLDKDLGVEPDPETQAWGPGHPAAGGTVKGVPRIRSALDQTCRDLNRPENEAAWNPLREMEPGHTRIQLFDTVWWMYFREVQPVVRRRRSRRARAPSESENL